MHSSYFYKCGQVPEAEDNGKTKYVKMGDRPRVGSRLLLTCDVFGGDQNVVKAHEQGYNTGYGDGGVEFLKEDYPDQYWMPATTSILLRNMKEFFEQP